MKLSVSLFLNLCVFFAFFDVFDSIIFFKVNPATQYRGCGSHSNDWMISISWRHWKVNQKMKIWLCILNWSEESLNVKQWLTIDIGDFCLFVSGIVCFHYNDFKIWSLFVLFCVGLFMLWVAISCALCMCLQPSVSAIRIVLLFLFK